MLVAVPVPAIKESPPAPPGLLKATRLEWEAFWADPLARMVKPSDISALERLFQFKDEQERCRRAVTRRPPAPRRRADEDNESWGARLQEYADLTRRTGRVVEGSQGQPVLNPLYRQISSLEKDIRQLEDRFGMTLASRLKLGITFADAAKSLEEINRRADADVDEEPDDDPRLAAVVLADDDGGRPAPPKPRRAGLSVDRG